MKVSSTLLLKLTLLIFCLPVLALCIYALPVFLIDVFDHASKGESLAYVLIGIVLLMYGSAFPYFLSLYQAYRLLVNIDNGTAFSLKSVTSLAKIKKYAFLITGFYITTLPLLYVVAQWDDAPGIIVIGLIIVGASSVVGIFAAILEKLLQEAIEYKNEIELTI